jgi:uncharacterized membrane protein YfcA
VAVTGRQTWVPSTSPPARPAGPDWLVGTITGLGGLAGSRVGAGMQGRLDERMLTGLLAVLVTVVAVAQLVR